MSLRSVLLFAKYEVNKEGYGRLLLVAEVQGKALPDDPKYHEVRRLEDYRLCCLAGGRGPMQGNFFNARNLKVYGSLRLKRIGWGTREQAIQEAQELDQASANEK